VDGFGTRHSRRRIETLRGQRLVKLAHDPYGLRIGSAENDAIGVKGIGDRRSLAQELGITGNAD
jgi:hypothetical protein